MKFLDLLDEKIDYLFKRGKNADERLYDFFIRTITFFVVVLIVLCYASFVHANGETPSSDQGEFSSFTEGFTNQAFVNWANENNFNYNVLSSIGIMNNTSYNTDVFNSTNIANLPNDGTHTIENSITCLGVGSGGGTVNSAPRYGVKYLYSDSPITLSAADGAVYAYSSSQIYCTHTQLNSNLTMYDSWGWETYNGQYVTSNISTDIGCYRIFVYGSQSDCCWVNCPYYSVDTSEGWQSNYDFIYAFNALPDKWININYEYETQFPEEVPAEVESNVNHLYLNDIQIGLTSTNNNQSLLASEVVIGIDVDDWILNNIDDYSLLVSYNINFKDTMVTNPNDPSGSTSVIVPLRSFYNNAYAYSVAEILRNINVNGIGTFLNYYNDLNSGGIDVVSVNTYNALLPSPLKELEYKLGQFWLNLFPESSTVNYTVFQFDLTVSAILVDHVSDEQSATYIKEFDFVHGAESVKSAEILRNSNPWEGESTPQQSPIVPSSGNSISNGSGGGNVSVTVNNDGNHKIPLNVHTKKELDAVIDNYGYVQQRLFSTFDELTDETKEDGYLSLLKQTLPEISREVPVIDFFLKCAIVSIALSLIIFILKVLIF